MRTIRTLVLAGTIGFFLHLAHYKPSSKLDFLEKNYKAFRSMVLVMVP